MRQGRKADKPALLPVSACDGKNSVGQRVLSSSVLFDGRNEVRIVHLGVEYVLRITRENKLILTK